MGICQNESSANELRLRTCLELEKSRDFYKTHPVLVNSRIPYHSGRNGLGIMSVETLCDLTCFDASSSCELGKKGFDAAFENEIFRTSLNYSYSRTLQVMALASVLGVPIQTVYPDQNHKLLPVYENVFQPRQGRHSSNSVFVQILWTNTQGWPDRSKEFTVNHFVPLEKERKRDRQENKEQKNKEKSEEQPPQVQEEKRYQPENKEHKNEENEMKKQGEQARFQIDERQNAQSNGQETVKPKRNSTINGKKRKHAMLFDMNDAKSDLCSSAKKNVHTPSEAAVKFVQDWSALPFPCTSQTLLSQTE